MTINVGLRYFDNILNYKEFQNQDKFYVFLSLEIKIDVTNLERKRRSANYHEKNAKHSKIEDNDS